MINLKHKCVSFFFTLIQLILYIFNIYIYSSITIIKPIIEMINDLNKRNIANYITLARLIITPLILFNNFYLLSFLIHILLDTADGYVARKFQITSDYGAYLDGYSDTLFHILLLYKIGIIYNLSPFLTHLYQISLIVEQLLLHSNYKINKIESARFKIGAQFLNIFLLRIITLLSSNLYRFMGIMTLIIIIIIVSTNIYNYKYLNIEEGNDTSFYFSIFISFIFLCLTFFDNVTFYCLTILIFGLNMIYTNIKILKYLLNN
jgi:phosphatidylglycerophosphate synthase